MPIMSKKYPAWRMQNSEMMEALTGNPKGKLPKNGLPARWIGGYHVKVLPAPQPQPRQYGNPNSSKHRVLALCRFCECYISYSRLHQHEPACNQRDNYSGS